MKSAGRGGAVAVRNAKRRDACGTLAKTAGRWRGGTRWVFSCPVHLWWLRSLTWKIFLVYWHVQECNGEAFGIFVGLSTCCHLGLRCRHTSMSAKPFAGCVRCTTQMAPAGSFRSRAREYYRLSYLMFYSKTAKQRAKAITISLEQVQYFCGPVRYADDLLEASSPKYPVLFHNIPALSSTRPCSYTPNQCCCRR